MNILGIDQSYTSSGWVFAEDGVVKDYGLIKTEKSDETHSIFKRAIFASNKLLELVDRFDPDVVNIEGLAMGGVPGNRARELAGLQWMIITKIMEKHPDIIINIPAPTQLKKLATGSGRAKKPELFDHLPDNIKDEFSKIPKTKGRFDLTDAYWLSKYSEDFTLEEAARVGKK